MSSTSTPFVLKHKTELRAVQAGRRKFIKMIGEEASKTNHVIKLIDNRIKFLSLTIQQQRQMNSDHYISRLNKSLPSFIELLGLPEDVQYERKGNMIAFILDDCIVTYSHHNSRHDAQNNVSINDITIIGDKMKVELNKLKSEGIKSFIKPFTTSMNYSYFKTIVGINYQLFTVSIIPLKGDE